MNIDKNRQSESLSQPYRPSISSTSGLSTVGGNTSSSVNGFA
ncbi:uncharacterized protein METZ01_LOCUS336820, partial [marine metagenome]